MNILILDQEGCGLDLAIKCALNDNPVRLVKNKPENRYGENFLSSIELINPEDWRKHMSWARDGLIINTVNAKYCKELDVYRTDFGYDKSIFSPSYKSSLLEIDREKGSEFAEKHGFLVPKSTKFNSLEEAQKFLIKNDRPYVFKVGGEEDKSLTFVSDNASELYGWIESKIQGGMKLKSYCLLQEKIEDIVAEVGFSGWMSSTGFLEEKWQYSFEHKKVMNDELYCNCGEQGTVTQYVKSDDKFEKHFKSMEKDLIELKHIGDFAVNGLVDKKGDYYFCEYTARFGYPCSWLQEASHPVSPDVWMKDSLRGKDSLKVDYRPAIVVVLSIPPFPFCPKLLKMDEKIVGQPVMIDDVDEIWPYFHPVSMMIQDAPVIENNKLTHEPQFQTTGEYVGVMTCIQDTLKEAIDGVYEYINKIHVPDLGYRTDIGQKVLKTFPELQELGYATQLK